jgi:hypothetical protein
MTFTFKVHGGYISRLVGVLKFDLDLVGVGARAAPSAAAQRHRHDAVHVRQQDGNSHSCKHRRAQPRTLHTHHTTYTVNISDLRVSMINEIRTKYL